MSVFELMIDEPLPSPNTYLWAHWRRYKAVKDRWALLVRAAGTPPTKALERAKVGICRYGKKLLDPDNLVFCAKPALDSLRLAGYLVDDTAARITLDVRQERVATGQAPCTLIVVEALD